MAEQLVLLTREQTAASRFQAQLQRAGVAVPVRIAPLLRMAWQELPSCPDGAGLLVTSHALAAHLPASYVQDRPLYVVGAASAERLAAKGARIKAQATTATELCAEMARSALPGPVMWLHGSEFAHDFTADAALSRRGITIRGVQVYRQIAQSFRRADLDAIAAASHIIAPVFSAQSAHRFCHAWPKDGPNVTVAAMSFAVAEAMLPAPGPVFIAPRPDAPAMVELIKQISINAQVT